LVNKTFINAYVLYRLLIVFFLCFLVIFNLGEVLEAAAVNSVVAHVQQSYAPGFHTLMMHFHASLAHAEGEVCMCKK